MTDSPWLIVGLGNPGPEYAKHRHNVGFMVVERWVDRHLAAGTGRAALKSHFKGRPNPVRPEPPIRRWGGPEPLTYMNRSGESVRAAVDFHGTSVERMVVVHDEIDFEF